MLLLLCTTSLQQVKAPVSSAFQKSYKIKKKRKTKHPKLTVNLLEKAIFLLQLKATFCWLIQIFVSPAKTKVMISVFNLVNS